MIIQKHMFVPSRILKTFTDCQFNFYLNEMTPDKLVYITEASKEVQDYLINEGYGTGFSSSFMEDKECPSIKTKIVDIYYKEKLEASFKYYNQDLNKAVDLTIMVYLVDGNLDKLMNVQNASEQTPFEKLDETVTKFSESDEEFLKQKLINLAKAYQVTESCASDIIYLRTRNRWTPELEKELIKLHKEGNPPNIMDFGCTPETGQALMDIAEEEYKKKNSFKD